MAVAMTGHQTRHRKSTKAERRAIFERTAPDSWKQMSADELAAAISKKENGGSLRNSELEAIGKSIGDRYDETCGMQSAHDWMMAVFEEWVRFDLACFCYGIPEPSISIALSSRCNPYRVAFALAAEAFVGGQRYGRIYYELMGIVPIAPKPKPIPPQLLQAKELVTDERPPTVQPAPKERHIVTPEPNSKPIDWSEERARCDEAWKKRKAKEDAEKEKQVSRDDLPTCKLMGIFCPPSTEEMRVRQMSKSARFWDEMYQRQDGWTAQNEKLFACKRDRYPTKEMAG